MTKDTREEEVWGGGKQGDYTLTVKDKCINKRRRRRRMKKKRRRIIMIIIIV